MAGNRHNDPADDPPPFPAAPPHGHRARFGYRPPPYGPYNPYAAYPGPYPGGIYEDYSDDEYDDYDGYGYGGYGGYGGHGGYGRGYGGYGDWDDDEYGYGFGGYGGGYGFGGGLGYPFGRDGYGMYDDVPPPAPAAPAPAPAPAADAPAPPPPDPNTIGLVNALANAPPGPRHIYRAGVTQLHSSGYVTLHVILNGLKPWEAGAAGQRPEFQIVEADAEWPVRRLMDSVGKKGPGWVLTEAVELGAGTWRKGTSIKWEDDIAMEPLENVGWSGRRGGRLPPVWLAVHRA
ncbi:uncharacterized protein K452DRAFT_293527 [Aplosporella prunicola CBS 121167]|uniref:Uncharacterized protein n=1 Tax=Aplosporella prunicola CBS 121167 TaxID=1176127 RepID=A0A6A6BVZ3_9PEZI|nr:uncharacterized protein K452DRAFT_293527 [Aplosporella prunicola CBS 121167]KAF2147037.1 hypothetical protein K452DRAFT_293527 [Aplosporella prunicola CBS 121167]